MRIVYLHCSEEVIKQEGETISIEKTVYSQDKYLVERLRSKDHEVHLVPYSENFTEEIKKINPDLVFNAADAFNDFEEPNKILSALESLGIPFTGCNKVVSNLFTYKTKAKKFFKSQGVNTPEFEIVITENYLPSEKLKYPLIIKPVETDASIGIEEDSVVYNKEQLNKKLSQVIPTYKKVIVEEYIDGREFCVPIIFSNGKVEVFPALEIDFTEHFENKPKILSYKAKWSKNSNAFKNTYSMAKELEPEVKEKLSSTAEKLFTSLNSSGYATMDVRFSNGRVYVLEVNPNPYLAIECDFIKSAKNLGMTPSDLIEKIVDLNKVILLKNNQ